MDYHEHMKQYYDRLAPDYDRSAASREEATEDLPGLLRAISLLPPARVLDVACGTGSLTPHLGPEVTGLDQGPGPQKGWHATCGHQELSAPLADPSIEEHPCAYSETGLALASRPGRSVTAPAFSLSYGVE